MARGHEKQQASIVRRFLNKSWRRYAGTLGWHQAKQKDKKQKASATRARRRGGGRLGEWRDVASLLARLCIVQTF